MQSSDETAPVYTPDFDLGSASDDTMFDTDSSSNFSMSTITSNQIAGYFRAVNGFLFSPDENIPSIIPVHPNAVYVDLMSHGLIRLSQDEKNVPPEADELLRASERTGGARVLHMVTNTGIWVQEMAEEYSTASFLSIDLKPLAPHKPHPRISFEVYDFYAGIAEPDESFDIVQVVNCVIQTKNFNFLLREICRVLKPNGILLLVEIPFQWFEDEHPSEPLHSAPNTVEFQGMIRRALEFQGIDLTAWDDMSNRLSPSHSHWTERSIDPEIGTVESSNGSGSSRGFYSIMQRTRLIPTGPWHEDEAQRMPGSLMGLMIMTLMKMSVPVLSMMGMEEADAQNLADKSLEEVSGTKFRRYIKLHHWSARKLPA